LTKIYPDPPHEGPPPAQRASTGWTSPEDIHSFLSRHVKGEWFHVVVDERLAALTDEAVAKLHQAGRAIAILEKVLQA